MNKELINRQKAALNKYGKLVDDQSAHIKKIMEELNKEKALNANLMIICHEQNGVLIKMNAIMDELTKMAGVEWRSMIN